MGGQGSGKGMVRRLAVLLGSAALVLPLAEPVGQQTGAVARFLLAMAATTMATPAQAQVQDTELWSATLTVRSSFGTLGCMGGNFGSSVCSSTNNLSENEFALEVNSVSTTFTVNTIYFSTSTGALNIQIIPALPADLTAANLVVEVGTQRFGVTRDDTIVSGRTTLSRANAGLSWTAGDEVALKLIRGTPPTADTTVPTVASIARQDPMTSPTDADALTWRVTFSEAVTEVDAADFAVTGTTATVSVAPVAPGTVATGSAAWDVTASGGDLADLDATVTLGFATGQNIEDLASNALSATGPTGANESYVMGNPPTVTSIARQAPTTSPTDADALTWRVTFSEAVENVDATDFAVSGTTATVSGVQAVMGETGVWDVTASGGDLADLNATVTLGFASGQDIADAAGNDLAETDPTDANESYVVDNLPTVVSLERFQPATSPTDANVLTWRVTFSEAVTGVERLDFTVGGTTAIINDLSTLSALSTTTGNRVWFVTVSGGNLADLDGTVTLDFYSVINSLFIRDAAGNQLVNTTPTSANENSYVVANPPTVTAIVRQNPAGSFTAADALTWRVTFSEAVENVDATDFTATGTTATMSVEAVTGETGVWDVTVSGGDLAELNDTVTLGFATGQNIADLAGNQLANTTPTVTNENSYQVTNVVGTPTVTISGTPTVTEGADLTFTLTLDVAAPLGGLPVTVNVSEIEDADQDQVVISILLESRTVTVPAGETQATFTVATQNDAVDNDSELMARIIADTADPATYYVGDPSSASVMVTDDDTRGFAVTGAPVTVAEGDTATYMVALTSEPARSSVIVTPRLQSITPSSDAPDVTIITPPALTFTSDNWSSPQVVMVQAARDTDSEDDSVRITYTADGADYDGLTTVVDVLVTEAGLPEVTIAAAAAPVTEGLTTNFALTRTGGIMDEALTVNVEVTETGDAVATANQGARTVTFAARSTTAELRIPTNNDATDEPDSVVTVTVAASTATPMTYGVGAAAAASVTVTDDDDAPRVTLAFVDTDPPGLAEISEGQADGNAVALRARLSHPSSEPTQVTITVPAGEVDAVALAPDPAVLTIPAGATESDNVVTLMAVEDDVARLRSRLLEIGGMAANDQGVGAVTIVRLTLNDNDLPMVSVFAAEAEVIEGEVERAFFTLRRTGDSSLALSVNLEVVFAHGDFLGGRTVETAWPMAPGQMENPDVRVAVRDNEFSPDSGTLTVRVVADTADPITYMVGTPSEASVFVHDDDALPMVTIAAVESTVTEGAPVVFTLTRAGVDLSEELTVNVSVTGTPQDVLVGTLAPSTVTFEAEATMAELRIMQMDDNLAEPEGMITATVAAPTAGVPATYAVGTTSSASVTVTDNDTRGVTMTPATLTINEGSEGFYEVVLTSQPMGNVTITPSSNNADVTFSSAALTFNFGNWDQPQRVTVTAAQDDDDINDTATITHTVMGADYGSVTAADVTVNVTDADTPPVTDTVTLLFGDPVTFTPVISEGGMIEIRARLNNPSPAETQVTLTVPPEFADGVSLSPDPPVLVIPAGATESSNAVTLTAVDDALAERDRIFLVGGTVENDQGVSGPEGVPLTVRDDDLPMVSIAAVQAEITEGEEAAFTLARTGPTTGSLVVMVRITVAAASTIEQQVTFLPGSATAATEPLTIPDDAIIGNDRTVTARVMRNADLYLLGSSPLALVQVADNDTRGVTVTGSPVAVAEGSTATYTVALTSEPTADVTVMPGSDDTDVVTVNPATLTFTPANWRTPQTVTVTALQDPDTDDETVTVSHTVMGANYGSVTAADVTVNVTDAAAPPHVVSVTRHDPATSPTNANSLTWRVVFSEAVTNVDTTDFMVSGSTATVTNVAQVSGEPLVYDVTVSGGNLADFNGTVTLGFASGQNIQDEAGIRLTTTPPPATNDNSYEVDNVAPAVSYPAPLDALVVGMTITPIRPSSMDTDIASYSASGLPTGLLIDETTGVISGASTTASTAEAVAMVTVTDRAGNSATVPLTFSPVASADQPGVSVFPTSLNLNEGATTSYIVTLNTQPTGPVTITPTSDNSGAVSVSPASMIFTTTNWDTPQTVTLTGLEDDNLINETVTIRHGVSGADYGAVAATAVQVTVNDNDTAADPTEPTGDDPTLLTKVKDALNEVVLPDILQQLTAETMEVITSRLNTIASGSPSTPPAFSLENVAADTVAAFHGQRERLKNGSLEWRQVLFSRDFTLPLPSLNLAQNDNARPQEDNLFSTVAVYGSGNYSSYNNIIETTDIDGNGFSGVIGMDLQPIPQLVTGLVLTTSRWELDYATDANGTPAEEGSYEISMTRLNPYINLSATEQLSLWATVGYGRGEMKETPEDGNGANRSDTFTSWAGGVRYEVIPAVDPLTGQGAPFGLAFKADGATSSFLNASVQLARLAAEVSRSFAIEDGLLTAALDLGWRIRSVSDQDDPDGQQSTVAQQNDDGRAELAGRLHWRNTDGSLAAMVDTRVLLGDHHREWGIGGALHLAPSQQNGEGLSITLQPSFGVVGTKLDALWSLSGNGDLAINNDPPGARLDAQLAYGFPLGNTILTPYTELSWEEAANAYGAGLRYGLNPFLELDLKGARHNNADGNNENRFSLQMHSDL